MHAEGGKRKENKWKDNKKNKSTWLTNLCARPCIYRAFQSRGPLYRVFSGYSLILGLNRSINRWDNQWSAIRIIRSWYGKRKFQPWRLRRWGGAESSGGVRQLHLHELLRLRILLPPLLLRLWRRRQRLRVLHRDWAGSQRGQTRRRWWREAGRRRRRTGGGVAAPCIDHLHRSVPETLPVFPAELEESGSWSLRR